MSGKPVQLVEAHSAPSQSALDYILELESQLNGAFFERNDITRSILVALIAEEHILLFGKPGTAKSDFSQAVASAIQKPYFETLMTKFSLPEELFGMFSIKDMQNDVFKRITKDMLPECSVAFLDEIFKANSAILNALLTLLNERKFDTGAGRIDVPLEVVIGASNEMPEDESLDALYDRFMLRHVVEGISTEDNWWKLMTRQQGTVTQKISSADLDELRAKCREIYTNVSGGLNDVEKDLRAMRDSFIEEGFHVSDRRWKKSMKIIAAQAVLEGRDKVASIDLVILKHVLWTNQEDIAKIETLVGNSVQDKGLRKAAGILADASGTFTELQDQSLKKKTPREKAASYAFWSTKSTEFANHLADLYSIEDTPGLDKIIDEVAEMRAWITVQTDDAIKAKPRS